jgi:hypothetical protein
MATCSRCARDLAPSATVCAACGEPVAGPASSPARAGLWSALAGRFPAGLLDPQAFIATARAVPWRERPEGWWDALSILGGMASGLLWFLYGSVRATRLGGWLTLSMILPLVLATFWKRQVGEYLGPLWTRVQGWPLGAKVIAILATCALVRQIPNQEGFDLISPLLMVVLPTALVFLRKEVDQLLVLLRPMRRTLPLPVRVGIGLAIPFATAFVLYNQFRVQMYRLMQWNTVVGTLLSYAVIRTPPSDRPHSGVSPAGVVAVLLLLVGLDSLAATSALADDFLRDPFNLNDGLRTDGIAPLIAGVSTAVVTMLINGVEVARTVIQDTAPPAPGETAQRKNFSVVVNTRDENGAPSTVIRGGTGDVLVYGHCEKAGARFPAGDATIVFSLVSGDPWVTLSDEGTKAGERCGRVALARLPPNSSGPPPTCTVQVTAGADALVSASVDLKIEPPDLELKFF